MAEASDEVRTLAVDVPGAVVLDGDAATSGDVVAALEGARLAHVAAHGHFRRDNPLFSAIDLVDGPLTVHDLQRLHAPPETLILSACDLGLSSVRPGDELMGLTGALLGLGTRTLIASVIPVPSGETLALMVEVHRALRAGVAAPEALGRAQRAVARQGSDRDLAAAASFVCFGG